MIITNAVKKILSFYNNENLGVKTHLCRILMQGRLAGSGKVVILPVDQGFEHGPDRSFIQNQLAYDPYYHYKFAIKAGLSAYAAPVGYLGAISDYASQIPLILKLNSNNSLLLSQAAPDQAFTSSVKDALTLGCAAVGITIYPGSEKFHEMLEEAKEVIYEAKSCGLAVVVWSYPRGGSLTKAAESALDVVSYGAHIAAMLGAHIIKVKLPSDFIYDSKTNLASNGVDYSVLSNRVNHIMQACFDGKRIVVFSGGEAKNDDDLFTEVKSIVKGGGHGSIIGRNSFQRKETDALGLLKEICNIYKQK